MSQPLKDFGLEIGGILSILVPGLILVFIVHYLFIDFYLFVKIHDYPNENQWLIIIVSAYFVGQIANWLGASFDWAYDKFYKPSRKKKENIEPIKKLAEEIKNSILSINDEISTDFSTFIFARKYITMINPIIDNILNRIDAESKFFRSLIIVLLISSTLCFIELKFTIGVIFLLFIPIVIVRYWSLRWKHTKETYNYFVMHFKINQFEKSK